MSNKRTLCVSILLLVLLLVVALPVSAQDIVVTINPAGIYCSLHQGQTQQFTATVTGSANTNVKWTLSQDLGTISSSGLYTAPAAIASQQWVMVTATSLADGTTSDWTAVILNPPVTVSVMPSMASLRPSETQKFAATVLYDDNTAVTWSLSPNLGSLDNRGLYTAPSALTGLQTVTVKATSVADTTKTASATVTLSPLPTISSVSSSAATAGAQIVISGSGFGAAQGSGAVWLGSTPGTVVTWSDTQIVAKVASNAISGSVYVKQWGLWSNDMPLTVSTATITDVEPPSAAPSAQVTITGSGFGALQGTGQVWLGGAAATVQSWNDGQIVVQVPAGTAGTGAQVLQNGVMSNAAPFTVNALHLGGFGVTPPGTNPFSITFTGTGFGTVTGAAWLGDKAANVVSWSDTQVVATVDPSANSGVAKIQVDGVWSNSKPFSTPGSAHTVVPSIVNMALGDTRTLQALNSSSQPVTGLAWTTSAPTVVTLSTDDPPVLTAVGLGTATIRAGAGSADVTVSATLPLGTTIWSNPGNGSGVYSIVPAVPSWSGVADVFAFQYDGTVQAITSDGVTAWTAPISRSAPQVLPDFQGGLVVVADDSQSVWKLDGMTGQPYPAYNANASVMAVRVATDGNLFAVLEPVGNDVPYTVVGIDPSTGTAKFTVPLLACPAWGPWTAAQNAEPLGWGPGQFIVAGDGYAYLPYVCFLSDGSQVMVLRVNSSGAYDNIPVANLPGWMTEGSLLNGIITNADTGVLFTFYWGDADYMAVTTGTSATLTSAPQVPGASGIVPMLQAQDGSFVGNDSSNNMIAFDASGNVRWVVPGFVPMIATADGGVIAQAWDPYWGNTGPGVTFDANGNVTGQTNLFTQSWLNHTYQVGSTDLVYLTPYLLAASFWALQGGNQGGTGTAINNPQYAPLKSCPGATMPCAQEAIMSALKQLKSLLQAPCSQCVDWVFNKLPGTDQLAFSQYLSRPPQFYDGTRSHVSGNKALCASDVYDQLNCQFGSTPVKDLMGTSDAMSQTPSDSNPIPGRLNVVLTGMQVFFNPSSGICNVWPVGTPQVGDQGVLNQAVLFHEALHGHTGKEDNYLESHFLLPVTIGESSSITYYLQGKAIPGGAYGAQACQN